MSDAVESLVFGLGRQRCGMFSIRSSKSYIHRVATYEYLVCCFSLVLQMKIVYQAITNSTGTQRHTNDARYQFQLLGHILATTIFALILTNFLLHLKDEWCRFTAESLIDNI
jgi:hypothetical protein